jgi:flagellar hook-basal body complex protein FliE
MTIPPISGINLTSELTKISQTNNTSDSFVSFGDVLNNMIDQVNVTDQTSKQDMVNLATGQTDDLHTVMMDSAKADLALQTLVQVRNKALDAYTEIMRITL